MAVQSEVDEHRHHLALYRSYEHTLHGTHCHDLLVIASQLSARVGVAFQSLAVLQCHQQAHCMPQLILDRARVHRHHPLRFWCASSARSLIGAKKAQRGRVASWSSPLPLPLLLLRGGSG